MGAACAPKCLLCPWKLRGNRALNYPPATASILLISSSKPSADERTQLRWLGRCPLDGLVDVTVSVPLQSSPSVCGCAEAAWRFCPAAASDTFLGSGTRMNSQKATHSRTLSESVVLFQTYTPQFLEFRFNINTLLDFLFKQVQFHSVHLYVRVYIYTYIYRFLQSELLIKLSKSAVRKSLVSSSGSSTHRKNILAAN